MNDIVYCVKRFILCECRLRVIMNHPMCVCVIPFEFRNCRISLSRQVLLGWNEMTKILMQKTYHSKDMTVLTASL